MNNKIKDAETGGPMYITWGDDEASRQSAVDKMSKAVINFQPLMRTTSSGLFRNFETNVSIRDSGSRRDYNYLRPNEYVQSEAKQHIEACMWACRHVGLLKNVVTTMANFSVKGFTLVHPNKKTQRFYRHWAKKVGLKKVARKFMNLLFRAGNVVVKRIHAKLKQKDIDNLHKGIAQVDVEPDTPPKILKNEIPYGYTISSPLPLEVVGGEDLAAFAGETRYALRIPGGVINKIKKPANIDQRLLVEKIPEYIVNAVRNGQTLVPLDPNKVSVYSLDKDDWQAWADPMCYCILDDLSMLNKLKLADLAALDGAISHVRVWKLGSLEHKLYPDQAAVDKLAEMLASAAGGNSIDVIWGPDLVLEETKTDISKFLGIEKFKATFMAIFDGLGIPIGMTAYGNPTGTTAANTYSLGTVIERLTAGREIFMEFLEQELIAIQQAFNFPEPAQAIFTYTSFAEENAEKALFVQLADRNIISDEWVVDRMGGDFGIETVRRKREQQSRDSGKLPRKASQWHNPEHKEALEKIALQSGMTSPKQHSLDLPDREEGDKAAIDYQMEMNTQKLRSQEAARKQKGVSGQGRPKNKKDATKRKRRAAASAYANALIWAKAAQGEISKTVHGWFKESSGKGNMRQLSEEEFKNLENLKHAILCNYAIYSDVNEATISSLLTREEPLTVPDPIQDLVWSTVGAFNEKWKREPNTDELREIQASVYALYAGEIDG